LAQRRGLAGITPVFTPLDRFGLCETIADAADQAVDAEVFDKTPLSRAGYRPEPGREPLRCRRLTPAAREKYLTRAIAPYGSGWRVDVNRWRCARGGQIEAQNRRLGPVGKICTSAETDTFAAIAYQDPVMVRKAQTQKKNRRYASKVAAHKKAEAEKFGLAPAAAKTTINDQQQWPNP
jgi:hypothetical protein